MKYTYLIVLIIAYVCIASCAQPESGQFAPRQWGQGCKAIAWRRPIFFQRFHEYHSDTTPKYTINDSTGFFFMTAIASIILYLYNISENNRSSIKPI